MITEAISFLQFSNDFRRTDRAIYAVGENRKENDVEHSFQLALFTMYVIDSLNLKLDKGLAVQYALIHDTPEVFDGDVHIFDAAGRVGKNEREETARKRIGKMFPEWTGYKELAERYKNLEDEESRLVNGLDKVIPVINIILDGGRTWKEEGTTLEKLVENKRRTTTIHPVSQKLWEELEIVLQERHLQLFGK